MSKAFIFCETNITGRRSRHKTCRTQYCYIIIQSTHRPSLRAVQTFFRRRSMKINSSRTYYLYFIISYYYSAARRAPDWRWFIIAKLYSSVDVSTYSLSCHCVSISTFYNTPLFEFFFFFCFWREEKTNQFCIPFIIIIIIRVYIYINMVYLTVYIMNTACTAQRCLRSGR